MVDEQNENGVARRLGLTRSTGIAYYQRGLKAFEDGDLENAILDLSEAIFYDDRHAEYYSTRGLFYVQNNNFEDARVDLDYALKLNKRQWLAHYALGIIDFNNGDFEEALKKFQHATSIRPDRPEVWYYRAITQHNIGDDSQAIADMERSEQLFPPGDKRRKDTAAWIKEFKKSALTPLPDSKNAGSLGSGASTTPKLESGQRPALNAPNRPQLNPPKSSDKESDDD